MTSATELGKQVEVLFLSYVDAGRREVQATLPRLQASSSMASPKRSMAASNAPREVKSSAPKRSREAMAQLAEKIVAVIHAHPLRVTLEMSLVLSKPAPEAS